jgi:hypothetical protein
MMMRSHKYSRSRLHEHAGSLHDVIELLNRNMTAESIMTPWPDVDFVTGERNRPEHKARACALMDRREYSAVPLVGSGGIVGVYLRHNLRQTPRFESVRPEHFVAAETDLLELIRRMRDTEKIAVGIGSAESPLGWLTYADFSKRPFRVLVFALMAEVEYLLAHALDLAYPDGSWLDLLDRGDREAKDERAELLKRQEEAEHWDVMMPVTTFAEMGHLIHAIAASKQALSLLGETTAVARQFRSIPELRNRVAHVVRPVVAGPKQISSVANRIDRMLEWTERWSTNLSAALAGKSTSE